MNLHRMLVARAEEDRPIRVGLIGAGKFGTMYLTQALSTVGVHVVGVADLNVERARQQLATAGWPAERYAAESANMAMRDGTTHVGDDALALIETGGLDVVIEATGIPSAAIRHCRAAIVAGCHVVMVSVEADVVAGPLLAQEARAAGLVYSLAWGDQPALICEHVDWARACGFSVVAAGKGTRYEPGYHQSTPDTVWDILDKYMLIDDRSGINPKMFNSFVDGSKSGIEMTAVCNATGLVPQPDGLTFTPCSRFELADICKPQSDGGVLAHAGTTDVVSSVDRSGNDVPHHLVMGTYVVIEGERDYQRQCFREYSMLPDKSGRYAALYRPIHMIGLELGLSVASAALRGEPTGSPIGFHSDVVAVAKRDLRAGERLDGEGGFCVWGRQAGAADSLARGYLPIGLAADIMLINDVAQGQILKWSDVRIDDDDDAVVARRAMEEQFASSSDGS